MRSRSERLARVVIEMAMEAAASEIDRLRTENVALLDRATAAEAERDSALKVADMNATAGSFTARQLENASIRLEAAEAALAAKEREAVATLIEAIAERHGLNESVEITTRATELRASRAALTTKGPDQ